MASFSLRSPGRQFARRRFGVLVAKLQARTEAFLAFRRFSSKATDSHRGVSAFWRVGIYITGSHGGVWAFQQRCCGSHGGGVWRFGSEITASQIPTRLSQCLLPPACDPSLRKKGY